MSRVVLGFSGGVDSAVCAKLLMQSGYELIGLYLDNAEAAEREYAIRAAEQMGIELIVQDVKQELEEKVCKPFTACYMRGQECICGKRPRHFSGGQAARGAAGGNPPPPQERG